jgi:hypothetical protein
VISTTNPCCCILGFLDRMIDVFVNYVSELNWMSEEPGKKNLRSDSDSKPQTVEYGSGCYENVNLFYVKLRKVRN